MMLFAMFGLLMGGLVHGQQCTARVPQVAEYVPSTASKFYIAGMFSLRESTDTPYECGKFRMSGLQFMEAFLWSVRKASAVKSLPAGLGVGAIGFDVCVNSDIAVQDVLNFEKKEICYGSKGIDPKLTFGYVGPEGNVLSGVSQLISSLKKTAVAVTSTMSYLTAEGWSDYQLRTVPSDAKQIFAIVAVLNKLQWKVIQMVYAKSMMGTANRNTLVKLASANGICIEQMIEVDDEEESYRSAVNRLKLKRKTRGVVLLLDQRLDETKPFQVRRFLEAVKNEGAAHMFSWLSTDAWDSDNQELTRGVETAAEGAVVIAPTIINQDQFTEFSTYFKGLKPDNSQTQNPWLKSFWEENFRCNIPPNTKYSKSCDSSMNLQSVTIDPRVTYIIQAVDAIIEGTEAARSNKCPGASTMCPGFINDQNLMTLAFGSIVKAGNERIFNATAGDAYKTRFNIMNYRRPEGSQLFHRFVKIGSFSQDGEDNPYFDMNYRDVFAYDKDGLKIDGLESKCDYLCVACALPSVLPPNGGETRTEDPSVSTASTVNGSGKAPVYNSVRKKTWIIPLMILAGLGIFIVVCFEIYVLSKFIGTKAMQKWRTMWLGQLLLVAVVLSYVVCFVFVPDPSEKTCGILRFGVGCCYAMIFSILLVKLMIIISSQSVGYLKGVYQILMFLFAFGVQVVIDTQWLILIRPAAYWDEGGWHCGHDFLAHVQSLVYVMFLILVCTLISVRTHGVVTNHREGMFIGLSAGFSIPLCLAWTLVGALNTNKEYQEPAMAYGLLLNATLVLFAMFLPKVRQLNTLGVEGIYLEDDREEGTVYGSAIYGPPSYKSHVINGGVYSHVDPVYVNHPQIRSSQSEYSPDPRTARNARQLNSLYLRHPGSVKSVPAYRGTVSSVYGTRVLHTSKDLTGKLPMNKRASSSEYGYGTTRSAIKVKEMRGGTMKRTHSLTDLGAL